MQTTIERDHFPELAENGGAFRLAEQIGLTETELSSAQQRRAALAELHPKELVEAIVGLNALLRNKKVEEGVIEDGQLASLTPPLEDKEPLLVETAQAFRDILLDTQLDDKSALRRAGLTLAGGLNFIHAFDNGNGRTARVAHYFIEFGAERGEKLFEAETYSAIGKITTFDSDFRSAVYDVPPDNDMQPALNAYYKQRYPTEWASASPRVRAGMRVRAFLDAMAGRANIATIEPTTIPGADAGIFANKIRYEILPAGTNIVTVYERQYVGMSFATSLEPDQIPGTAERAWGKRADTPLPGTGIRLPADFL